MNMYIYIYTSKCIYIYICIYIYVCIYISCLFKICFRQCQWDASCRACREPSNALVKSDCCLTYVETLPFPFRNAPAPVTASL